MARIQNSGTAPFSGVLTTVTLLTVPTGVNFFLDYFFLSAPTTALTSTQFVTLLVAGITVARLSISLVYVPPTSLNKPWVLAPAGAITLVSTGTPSTSVVWSFAGDEV